jgi:hypothetical protein
MIMIKSAVAAVTFTVERLGVRGQARAAATVPRARPAPAGPGETELH